MSTWFTVVLDTTPPIATIYAPYWTTTTEDAYFTVAVNEAIDLGRQEAKVIDSQGNEFPIIMAWDGEYFNGLIHSEFLQYGTAKIVVKLWDEAGNPCYTERNIQVMSNLKFFAEGSARVREINTEVLARSVTIDVLDSRGEMDMVIRLIDMDTKQRDISLKFEEVSTANG